MSVVPTTHPTRRPNPRRERLGVGTFVGQGHIASHTRKHSASVSLSLSPACRSCLLSQTRAERVAPFGYTEGSTYYTGDSSAGALPSSSLHWLRILDPSLSSRTAWASGSEQRAPAWRRMREMPLSMPR